MDDGLTAGLDRGLWTSRRLANYVLMARKANPERVRNLPALSGGGVELPGLTVKAPPKAQKGGERSLWNIHPGLAENTAWIQTRVASRLPLTIVRLGPIN